MPRQDAMNRARRLAAACLLLLLSASTVHAACSADDILLTFEEPADGAHYSAIGNIRGWAWAKCGVERIELHIDGDLFGNIPSGGIRFDVPQSFPEEQYPGSTHSGFSMAYNYGNLVPSQHTMEVRVIDSEGNSRSARSSFSTNRFGQRVTHDVGEVDITDASFTRKPSGFNVIGARVNGGAYDFELNWRDAVQGFMIENIAGRDSALGTTLTEAEPTVRSLSQDLSPADAAWPATTSRAVQSNGIILNFEEPVSGGGYTSISNIRGWAISPAGMERIELYIDGQLYGEIPMGGTRKDVAIHYPTQNYPGSDQSGFAMAYNYANLAPGEHTLTVRAYDAGGAMAERSSTVTVSRFGATPFVEGESLLNLTGVSLQPSHNALTVTDIVLSSSENRFNSRLEFDRASQMFKTQNVNQGNYRWHTGQWSDCNGICGTLLGSRTRTVSCRDQADNTVDSRLCPPPTPASETHCTACDAYTWERGPWGACTGECGWGLGTHSRVVTCVDHAGAAVDESFCGNDKPDQTQRCSACADYAWHTDPWGPCQGDCGAGDGSQQRQVYCRNLSGEMVDDALCSGDRPLSARNCTIESDQCSGVDDGSLLPACYVYRRVDEDENLRGYYKCWDAAGYLQYQLVMTVHGGGSETRSEYFFLGGCYQAYQQYDVNWTLTFYARVLQSTCGPDTADGARYTVTVEHLAPNGSPKLFSEQYSKAPPVAIQTLRAMLDSGDWSMIDAGDIPGPP